MVCVHEFFLDQYCSIPLFLPLLLLVAFFAGLAWFFVYSKRTKSGAVQLLFLFSNVLIASEFSILIRLIAYAVLANQYKMMLLIMFIAVVTELVLIFFSTDAFMVGNLLIHACFAAFVIHTNNKEIKQT
jgi:hypothetical protein